MLFIYEAITQEGQEKKGTIEAINLEAAVNSLQKRKFIISNIVPEEKNKGLLNINITWFEKVKTKDVVILSRQFATLFEAQVSALKIFQLLAAETENPKLSRALVDVSEQIKGGETIANSLAKYPKIFSSFYTAMVRAGEESGNLDKTFGFLADYLDRTYQVVSKAKNALVYPAFVILTFVIVMILMFTVVIPKIAAILVESGQDIPIYTKIILGMSDFLIAYGVFLLLALAVATFFGFKYVKTKEGRTLFDKFKVSIPFVGHLYKTLYLSRLSDNMNTMLSSGIPMIRALELTKDVVDNVSYRAAIDKSIDDIRGGSSVSDAFSKHEEFPNVLVQMVKVGEETGNLGKILKTLSNFYQREVTQSVDTLVGLIEPVMIILLGLGVGTLLISVLVPIYNISGAF
jgi:type IV pilus assembly protein PilC